MTTFVLVHGAWRGSWCWKRVRKTLQAAGHDVFTPTLTGVADRVPDRLRALVYLDAFILEDGQSLHDTLPPPARAAQVDGANKAGDGWRVPPIPAELFNVNVADRAWVDAQCTPQSLATFSQRLSLRNRFPAEKVTHVLATNYEQSPFRAFHELAKKKGWHTATIDGGHDVMLDRPDDLVRILLDAAHR